MGQPSNLTMSSSISVQELSAKRPYYVQVACGRREGLSNYTDPVVFATRESAVQLSPQTTKDLISTADGKLMASTPLALAKDTCLSQSKSECIYKPPTVQPTTGDRDAAAVLAAEKEAVKLKKEKCGETCEPGADGKVTCTKDFPEYWTKPECPLATTTSVTSTQMPGTIAPTQRRSMLAGRAGASVGSGEAPAGAECHEYEDTRGESVKGNIVRACYRNGKLVSSTYILASANIQTNERGEVTASIPDDLPPPEYLAPKGVRARHLLQTLPGPVFANGALLGLGERGVDDCRRSLAAPSFPRVVATTFRSVSVAFTVPVNEAYDVVSGQSIPISKCSLLSLGVDSTGAESAAEVASGVPTRASEMSMMVDRLAANTAYRMVAVCSNSIGSSPRSAVVAFTTPAMGIQLDFDSIGSLSMDGSFVANAPIKLFPPMAAAADRRACLAGTFFAVPRVEIGRFSRGSFTDAITVDASLNPPIPERSTEPSTSVCFVIPASPYAASARPARHLLVLSTGAAHSLRVTDVQTGSSVVVQNAVIWRPAGAIDANRTGLNCSSFGAIRSCSGNKLRRLSAHLSSNSTADFFIAGTFGVVPTSVMFGQFDLSTAAAVCAHPAANVRLCNGGLCFDLPMSPPLDCALGTGRMAAGRSLLLASEKTYDLRIDQADGEQTLVTNFVQWQVAPTTLSAWSGSQAAAPQPGGSNTSHIGLGLGLGLGLGAVLLLVGGIWGYHYYRRSSAQWSRKSRPRPAAGTGADPPPPSTLSRSGRNEPQNPTTIYM
eukprot:tig00020878_g14861.t1